MAHLLTEGLCRIAVPFFFIVSGYFYERAVVDGRARQWIGRVFRIYVVWTVLYAYFWVRPTAMTVNGFLALLPDALLGYTHLWYLSGLIGAGLLLLALDRLGARPWHVVIAIALTFVAGVVLQYGSDYALGRSHAATFILNTLWFRENFLIPAFPFMAIGYLFHRYRAVDRFSIPFTVAGAIVGIALILVESYVRYRFVRDGFFVNMVSLGLVSPALFLLVARSGRRSSSRLLALLSAGVYLVHPALLRVILYLDPSLSSAAVTAVVIPIAIVAAYLIALANKRLPVFL